VKCIFNKKSLKKFRSAKSSDHTWKRGDALRPMN
jgi:hypothetical protein